MMAIDLSIPAYKGGYRMDADALHQEMVSIRNSIVEAVLSEEERKELRRPSLHDTIFAQNARIQELLPERLENRDRHGWTVQELYQRLQQLRAEMEREYGIVR